MTREEKMLETRRLRRLGVKSTEVARRLGISASTVRNWWTDRVCAQCAAPIDWASASLCLECYEATRYRSPHGTRSKYDVGCRCEECRAANTRYMHALKKKPAPNHGTESGYSNYGCRCEQCRTAHREYGRAHPEYQRRWREKIAGTEPPRHGCSTAYNAYGCRCAECRAWAARDWKQRGAKRRRAKVAA